MAMQNLFLSAFQNIPPVEILLFAAAASICAWFFIYKKNADYRQDLKRYEQAVRQMAKEGVLLPESLDGSVLEERVYQEIVEIAIKTRNVIPIRQPQIFHSNEILLTGVDEKTAAMLMAIVCDSIGGDPSLIQFNAIRAL